MGKTNQQQTELFKPMFKEFDKEAYFADVKKKQEKAGTIMNKGIHILKMMLDAGCNPLKECPTVEQIENNLKSNL